MSRIMRRRIGRFEILGEMVDKNPELVQAIMAQCIIVRCEHLYASDVFEYFAISNHFTECPAGMAAPTYSVKNNEHGVWFTREDH